MPLVSMTGFGRASGEASHQAWSWELRSVNGRTLDLRLRLPPGWDSLETEAKAICGRNIARGSCTAQLSLASAAGEQLTLNEPVLKQYLALSRMLAQEHGMAVPSTAELLALRGVVESAGGLDDAALAQLRSAVLAGLAEAITGLQQSRAAEGARLAAVIAALLDRIAAVVNEAEAVAAAQPEAQRARLAERLDELLAGRAGLDAGRLEQEVALLALKSDVREELDRLTGHIAAARALLDKAEPVGRAFDFLAQEFNREANTLCSKAALPALTRLGLDLKALIDQLREQVQNIE